MLEEYLKSMRYDPVVTRMGGQNNEKKMELSRQ